MVFKEMSSYNRNLILNLSGVATAILFFISGVGSYRFFVVYAVHCLMRALGVEQKYIFIFLPAYIVSMYIDVTSGPVFFIHTTRPYHYLIILMLFVIADSLMHSLFKKGIGRMTEGQFFVECPSCHFDNIQLVEKCSNCSYDKSTQMLNKFPKLSPSFKGSKVPATLINLLNLDETEEILFHKKLTRNIAKYKNGERQSRKHLVITTANIIILDYYSFHLRMPNSWRERDVIPLSHVAEVEGKMKQFYMAMRPFLVIKTIHGDIYEIVLSIFLGKYIEEINEIVSIIKNANPQIEVKVNLTEQPWNKSNKL